MGSANGHEEQRADSALAGTEITAGGVSASKGLSPAAATPLEADGDDAQQATQQMAASLAAMLSNALTFGAPGTASWPTQPVLGERAQQGASGSCSALGDGGTPTSAPSAVPVTDER